jgi:hypothetical protein
MCGARARSDAEVLKQRSPTRCGGLPARRADAKVHARLAEAHRQQLRVAVGEVQQADVAERRMSYSARPSAASAARAAGIGSPAAAA